MSLCVNRRSNQLLVVILIGFYSICYNAVLFCTPTGSRRVRKRGRFQLKPQLNVSKPGFSTSRKVFIQSQSRQTYRAARNIHAGFEKIVITFYSPSCRGQKTAKGPFRLQVKLPPAHLSVTHGRGFTLFLYLLNVKQGSCE